MPESDSVNSQPHKVPAGMPEFGASGRKIIYDENGKPCRSCNTLLDFRMVTGKKQTPSPNTAAASPAIMAATPAAAAAAVATQLSVSKDLDEIPNDCPPDILELGRSTWTLLHSIAASYPDNPTKEQQENLSQFMTSFGNLFPCFWCAKDFRKYSAEQKINVTNRDEFGKWLCNAHNSVNTKLGKPTFDCNLWKERWKDGWKDGRCD